jgi:hypothetical protein
MKEMNTTFSARWGHHNCVAALHNAGYPFGCKTIECAVMAGSLKCLQYVYEHGAHVSLEALWFAALNGHLDCLKFLLQNMSELIPDVFRSYVADAATRGGHPEVIAYVATFGALADTTE